MPEAKEKDDVTDCYWCGRELLKSKMVKRKEQNTIIYICANCQPK